MSRPRVGPRPVAQVVIETAHLPNFDEFFRSEYRAVVALGFALCGSWATAEDLAQDAFADAHRRWERIGAYDAPGAWVRRAVANRSVSVIRKRVSEAAALARLAPRTSGQTHEPQVIDHEFWDAVRSLPRRQRQVIALHYVEDLAVADIAAVLGLGEPTVKTHLQRARASLAETLGEDPGERR